MIRPNPTSTARQQNGRLRRGEAGWDHLLRAIVLNDVAYTEVVRLEVLGTRKIGENPVLATREFEVHDIMGLSLRDKASVFQLECDRSRARFGVISMAFRFDPPVAPDVARGLDESALRFTPQAGNKDCHQGSPQSMTRTRVEGQRSEPGQKSVEPVYMNVAGHFACLLLDDDVPLPQADPAKKVASIVVRPSPRARNGEPTDKIVHPARPNPRQPQPVHNASQDRRTHGSFTSESDASSSDLSESMKNRDGETRLGSGFTSNSTSVSGARSTKESRQRSSSFVGLAYQLGNFGGRAGVVTGKGTPPHGAKVTRPATPLSMENSPSVQSSKRLDETPPQQRWKIGRLRRSKQEGRGGDQASTASGSASRRDSVNTRNNNNSCGSRRAANVPRPGARKEGFLRRSFGATPGSGGRSKAKLSSLGSAACECDMIAATVDAEPTSPAPSTVLRASFSADEIGDESTITYDSRYDMANEEEEEEGGSCWQP